MIKTEIEKIIESLEKIEKEFQLKHVHHDAEYHTYCKKYLSEAKFYLEGVLYYMNK